MRIEVIARTDQPQKTKGDLLENLLCELLEVQSYTVTTQVRVTACELDLLCKHKVSGEMVYVECKAHREPLSANHLKNLLGTVSFKEYSEGWLVSTGPLGKEAKGFVTEWEQKPQETRKCLSVYDPKRVIEALVDAKLLVRPPETEASRVLQNGGSLGDWTLLISESGRYWACTVLDAGVPTSVVVFEASDGQHVRDSEILDNLKATDSSLKELAFVSEAKVAVSDKHPDSEKETAVVEVEFGEKWTDYRPARPEHFVGRAKARRTILSFFADVKKKRTDSRVFAVKGDSGIGKSSLVAKLRAVAKTSKKPANLFLYAVDMRAANNSSYVHTSLLSALRQAAEQGFGHSSSLQVSNYADPLQSETIRDFFSECEKKHELIILVFDQFEELYSKPGLFPVFDETKKLMFSALSAATNFVLGFAWKTDTTVPQDHPAYHMWHELADHRYEITLSPFSHADAENSLRMFETELGERIRPELRKYLIENSQGYPWLLKKLCIHLYEQIEGGTSQPQLADRALDIASLFERDLGDLPGPEMTCLKLVAEHAPMDWYEVLETTGTEVVQALQHKRLLIRRGDKLNLYWDIFRDYVLAGAVPSIPFTYTPQAPSIGALLRIALQLDTVEPRTPDRLAKTAELSESTARNILHDLEQFGIANITSEGFLLDSHMTELTSYSILGRIRIVFRRHALTVLLRENNSTEPASQDQVVRYLRSLNPTAKHDGRTWDTYASRMCLWLSTLGYLERCGDGFVIYADRGDIVIEDRHQFTRGGKKLVFLGDAPPARVVDALDLLKREGPLSIVQIKARGYRNACIVLYRFRLIELTPAHDYRIAEDAVAGRSSRESVWEAASREESLICVLDHLKTRPQASGSEIGSLLAERFAREWSDASCVRTGNALLQWAYWLAKPRGLDGQIPNPPPGRRASDKPSVDSGPFLFPEQ